LNLNEVPSSHHLSAKKSPVLHSRTLGEKIPSTMLGLGDNSSSSGVFKVPPLPS